MTVEAASYPADLNTAYPASTDPRAEGDDQIRLIKSVVKNAFGNVSGAVTSSHTELNMVDGLTGTIRTSTSTPIAGEWVQMRDVTTTAVASIDFIHGANGVSIDTNYDAYEFYLYDILHNTSDTALMQMKFSVDAGSTFTALTISSQSSSIASGSQTLASHTGTTVFPITAAAAAGGHTSTADALAARIWIARSTTNPDYLTISCEWAQAQGLKAGWVRGQANATGTSAFNALRLTWDSGSFAVGGRIKLFGRRAA